MCEKKCVCCACAGAKNAGYRVKVCAEDLPGRTATDGEPEVGSAAVADRLMAARVCAKAGATLRTDMRLSFFRMIGELHMSSVNFRLYKDINTNRERTTRGDYIILKVIYSLCIYYILNVNNMHGY